MYTASLLTQRKLTHDLNRLFVQSGTSVRLFGKTCPVSIYDSGTFRFWR